MASKKTTGSNQKQARGRLLPLAVAVVLVVVCLGVYLIPRGGQAAEAESGGEAQTIQAGESLEIPISEITAAASFYPVSVNGTEMEILAVLDSQGNIRTAFNTCQVCYSSGRGYYVQDGDVLVCQNCGNRFTVDQVEIETGGCNPWPIFETDKTVTDEAVLISYDFLDASRDIFARWKNR